MQYSTSARLTLSICILYGSVFFLRNSSKQYTFHQTGAFIYSKLHCCTSLHRSTLSVCDSSVRFCVVLRSSCKQYTVISRYVYIYICCTVPSYHIINIIWNPVPVQSKPVSWRPKFKHAISTEHRFSCPCGALCRFTIFPKLLKAFGHSCT